MDAHLKAIWLDQVSELKPGALNKNFLRYASSNTNMKQKKLGKDLAAKFTTIYIYIRIIKRTTVPTPVKLR